MGGSYSKSWGDQVMSEFLYGEHQRKVLLSGDARASLWLCKGLTSIRRNTLFAILHLTYDPANPKIADYLFHNEAYLHQRVAENRQRDEGIFQNPKSLSALFRELEIC